MQSLSTRRTAFRRAAASLAVATGLMAQPVAAQSFDLENLSPEQREAFRAEVREYLLDNPEVIMEAVSALEAKQQQQQAAADEDLVAANAGALFDDGYSWVGGNPDGDVTIVEFSDYRCGYCRKAFPEVEQLVESDGNIRIVIKEFPILGQDSVTSSRFALATMLVEGPDAYKQMHDALISLKQEPSEPVLSKLADTLGLDGEAILAKMSDPEVDRRIKETHELAQRLQISGTPTFVFGDQMLRGYVPIDGMRQIVDQIRSEG
ncbi:disulfide bond formation protein DsbA [Salipiger sp. CCB-MM3]|uniref:DsbA family protein n=1 Tax=Salipiger sp. CCB-MM3 TaxID=1792508 RepID=UPI00080A9692|nr:DsbA family protein [Salipiger sp. CCB-MM3]ANT61564.1 disulfide bond formation protein DsbA [Salipiger sp. CCB-MM3]